MCALVPAGLDDGKATRDAATVRYKLRPRLYSIMQYIESKMMMMVI